MKREMKEMSKIFSGKFVGEIILVVVSVAIGACVTFYTGALNSQVSALNSQVSALNGQASFWERRANILKDNVEKMKIEADKLSDKCEKEKIQDPAVKSIKMQIDKIYRDSIPTSFKGNR